MNNTSEGRAQLEDAFRRLMVTYRGTQPIWDDKTRDTFEEYRSRLDPTIRRALLAMERFEQDLGKIRYAFESMERSSIIHSFPR